MGSTYNKGVDMRKTSFLLLFILASFYSCSKKEKSYEYTKVVSEIEFLNQQQLKQSSTLSSGEQFSLNTKKISSGEKSLNLSDNLCLLINKKQLDNPFEFEKYFSKNIKFNDFKSYTNQITQLSNHCYSSEIIMDHYPISIIKLNLAGDNSLYAFFRVDKEKLIQSYYFLSAVGLNITHELVRMSDGEEISSITFSNPNVKRGTFFIKTPYLHTSSFGYYINSVNSLMKMNMNVVIQSNRGSHASTGNFKWLHEKNIEDSKETIEWITKQKFSNGAVISYGVSYDGYNALAAAASNARGLISAVACSAPSNAETDSFTAGKTVESRLLDYIAERENPDQLSLYDEKFSYLFSKNTPFEDYDNLLYGRDIADWTDLTNARENGELSEYFKERSILEELKESHIPIFHIAGTDNDQDGRDTVLAFEALRNDSINPKNHFLYLHHQGHGCGGFFEKEFAFNFLQGKMKDLKSEYRDHSEIPTGSNNVEGDFRELTLTLGTEARPAILNNRLDIAEGKSLQFGGVLEEDLVVNGTLKLKFTAKSSLKKTAVIVSLFNTENGEWEVPHSMTYGISRTSIYFEDNSEGEYSLTLPPMFFKLNKGEAILISLSAAADSFVDFFVRERENYYEINADAGFIEVLDSRVNLTLPVEVKKEKLEEA
ncbi:MAG: hypothetical protein CES88_05900 [Halobacteriovorax sp. JY17]|nr:MAG: hypothetical protein CES88_05900 [Halobacteriovorax sp. JY17]